MNWVRGASGGLGRRRCERLCSEAGSWCGRCAGDVRTQSQSSGSTALVKRSCAGRSARRRPVAARACDGAGAPLAPGGQCTHPAGGHLIDQAPLTVTAILALVDAAPGGRLDDFDIYAPFTGSHRYGLSLSRGERAVEQRLRESGPTDTILCLSYFMEMWLGPALGFDLARGSARVLGSGDQRVSWISAHDVVRAIVACVDNPRAHGQGIELGQPTPSVRWKLFDWPSRSRAGRSPSNTSRPTTSSNRRARQPEPTLPSSRR